MNEQFTTKGCLNDQGLWHNHRSTQKMDELHAKLTRAHYLRPPDSEELRWRPGDSVSNFDGDDSADVDVESDKVIGFVIDRLLTMLSSIDVDLRRFGLLKLSRSIVN